MVGGIMVVTIAAVGIIAVVVDTITAATVAVIITTADISPRKLTAGKTA